MLSIFLLNRECGGSPSLTVGQVRYLRYFLCFADRYEMWQVGDLGFANELGNYAEYSGAPNEEETLHFARALIDVSFDIGGCHSFDLKLATK